MSRGWATGLYRWRGAVALEAWAGLLFSLAAAAGLFAALAPGFGGRLTTVVLTLAARGPVPGVPATGVAPLPVNAPLWAALVVHFTLTLGFGAIAGPRHLFADRGLPVWLGAPLTSPRLLLGRVLAASLSVAGSARPTLLVILALAVAPAGAASGGALTAGVRLGALVAAVAGVLASGVSGSLVALIVTGLQRRHPTAGRLVYLVLGAGSMAAAVPVARAGPGALGPWVGLGFLGAVGLALVATAIWLGPAYRRLATSPWSPPSAARPATTTAVPAAAPAIAPAARAAAPSAATATPTRPPAPSPARFELRGPGGAVVHRDLGLALSNPLTWARLGLCVVGALLYLVARVPLGRLGAFLGPGLFGVPLAYTAGVWFLCCVEVLTGLGKVDEAMALTLLAGPLGERGRRKARTLANAALGVPAALSTAALVLAIEWRFSVVTGPEALAFLLAAAALAAGQAALAAGWSRLPAAREDDDLDSPLATAGPAVLLEQVPLTPAGLRAVGWCAGHAALVAAFPALAAARLGLDPWPGGVLGLVTLALLPALAVIAWPSMGGRGGTVGTREARRVAPGNITD